MEKDKAPFGKSFWEEVQSLTLEESRPLDGTWVTAGRLKSLVVGGVEATECIQPVQ